MVIIATYLNDHQKIVIEYFSNVHFHRLHSKFLQNENEGSIVENERRMPTFDDIQCSKRLIEIQSDFQCFMVLFIHQQI